MKTPEIRCCTQTLSPTFNGFDSRVYYIWQQLYRRFSCSFRYELQRRVVSGSPVMLAQSNEVARRTLFPPKTVLVVSAYFFTRAIHGEIPWISHHPLSSLAAISKLSPRIQQGHRSRDGRARLSPHLPLNGKETRTTL